MEMARAGGVKERQGAPRASNRNIHCCCLWQAHFIPPRPSPAPPRLITTPSRPAPRPQTPPPQVLAYVNRVRDVEAQVDHAALTLDAIESNPVRCPDAAAAELMYQGEAPKGWRQWQWVAPAPCLRWARLGHLGAAEQQCGVKAQAQP